VGWAIFILVVATALFRWPVEAGRAADASITTTMAAVNGGLNTASGGSSTTSARTAAANTHEMLLYQSWLAGTFGESNSDTAKVYGPQLFDATALTWREAQILRQDPARGKTIVDDKKAKYAQVAERVKNADPDAYEYLTGKRSESRVGYALLALVGAMFALPFLLGAALIVLASFLVVRFAVMLFPAFATLALFPSMRRFVVGAGNLVAAALINGVIFAAGVVIVLRAIGLLLDPSSALPRWLSLTLMLLVSVVMWVVLRPVRRLGALVVGRTRTAPEPADVSDTVGSQARHARRASQASESAPAPASGPVPAEIHTIAEGTPSAGMPGSYRRPPGEASATTLQRPSTAPGLPQPPADAWTRDEPVDQTPSPNGKRPVQPDGPSATSPPPEQRAAPSRTPPAPAHNEARSTSPAVDPSANGHGGAAAVAGRVSAEESSGPLYVPGRDVPGRASELSSSRVTEPDIVRSEEEATSPVYRPADRGRAPTRSGA
jgi:hypothetical protein